MSWDEVPNKLVQYAAEQYAPENAAESLLNQYGALTVDHVPAHRREEFEADLDYMLGACVNLRNSVAVGPQ